MQQKTLPVTAPHEGILVSIEVKVGDAVQRGQRVAVLEAMKMESMVEASCDGVVREIAASVEEAVSAGQPLLLIEPVETTSERVEQGQPIDLDASAPTCRRCKNVTPGDSMSSDRRLSLGAAAAGSAPCAKISPSCATLAVSLSMAR